MLRLRLLALVSTGNNKSSKASVSLWFATSQYVNLSVTAMLQLFDTQVYRCTSTECHQCKASAQFTCLDQTDMPTDRQNAGARTICSPKISWPPLIGLHCVLSLSSALSSELGQKLTRNPRITGIPQIPLTNVRKAKMKTKDAS